MVRRRFSLLVCASLLVGCKPEATDDVDTGDTVDTAFEPTDTDDTAAVDTEPDDTADTGIAAEVATIPQIRDNTGSWSRDDILRVEDVVVTATWQVSGSPVFSVQDPAETSRAALLVQLSPGDTLPGVDSTVTVTGAYEEIALAGGTADATVLKVASRFEGSGWTDGTAGVGITALEITPATLATSADDLEFMVVSVAETAAGQPLPLTVTTLSASTGRFQVRAPSGQTVTVVPDLFDLPDALPDLQVGGSIDRIDGIALLGLSDGFFGVAPRSVDDAGTVELPADTGDTGDTDPPADTGDTGDTGGGLDLSAVATDQLYISELMLSPATCAPTTDGQYVELVYTGPLTVDAGGLTLENAARNTFVVAPGEQLVPNTRFLMHARPGGAGCHGFDALGWPLSFTLNTATETLTLSDGQGRVFDEVVIDGTFPPLTGHAIEFDDAGNPSDPQGDNDDGGNWCISTDRFAPNNELGTPTGPLSCIPGDTDLDVIPITSPEELHIGQWSDGSRLILEDLIVTAVYDGPAGNDAWLTAQVDRTTPEPYDGVWIFAGLSSKVHPVGTLIDLDCVYDAQGSQPGRRALDVMDCSGLASTITDNGLGTVPQPVDLGTGDSLRQNGTPLPPGEQWEGMLVTMAAASTWTVCDEFNSGTRPVSFMRYTTTGTSCGANATDRWLGGWFADLGGLNMIPPETIDTFTEVTGIVRYIDRGVTNQVHYDVHPRSLADVTYQDNP